MFTTGVGGAGQESSTCFDARAALDGNHFLILSLIIKRIDSTENLSALKLGVGTGLSSNSMFGLPIQLTRERTTNTTKRNKTLNFYFSPTINKSWTVPLGIQSLVRRIQTIPMRI